MSANSLAPRLLAGFDELRPMLQSWQSQLRGATHGAIEQVTDPLLAAREQYAGVAAQMSDLLPGKPPADPAVLFGALDPGIGATMATKTVPHPGEYGWLYADLAEQIGKPAASNVNASAHSVRSFVGLASDRINGAMQALEQGVVTGNHLSVRSQAQLGVNALDHAIRSVDQLTLDLRGALHGAN